MSMVLRVDLEEAKDEIFFLVAIVPGSDDIFLNSYKGRENALKELKKLQDWLMGCKEIY